MRMAACHPDRKHYAKGLCRRCYQKGCKRDQREYAKKWREENREYILEYRKRPEVVARQKALDRERYQNNAEQRREYRRRYHQEHKDNPEYIEKTRLRNKRYNDNMTKEKRRDQYLRYRCGIAPEDYAAMLNKQGGRCAICGKSAQENGRNLAVDHDHETNIIRGLLCIQCNTMLGNAKDDSEVLRAGALYLERFIDE